MTNDIYASFNASSYPGVAVITPGTTAPTTYITGDGMSPNTNGLVAITPDGSKTYVVNPDDGTVSVIDNSTNTALTGTGYPITVGTSPVGIAATDKYVLVANNEESTISVIDTMTDAVTSTITEADGLPANPGYIAVTPDFSTAFVTHYNEISAIDLTGSAPALKTGTGYPISTNVSDSLAAIAVTPNGFNAYVAADPFNGAVDVLDLTVDPPVCSPEPIPLSTGATALAVRPDGLEVWVIFESSSDINVIDTESGTVSETFSVGSGHNGIAFSADSSLAYVTNSSGGGTGVSTISVIDTEDYTVTSTITFPSGDFPNAIAIQPAPAPPPSPSVYLCSDWFG
jgi:YVTN family beta-propeller protein